jgi:hypothetical protein
VFQVMHQARIIRKDFRRPEGGRVVLGRLAEFDPHVRGFGWTRGDVQADYALGIPGGPVENVGSGPCTGIHSATSCRSKSIGEHLLHYRRTSGCPQISLHHKNGLIARGTMASLTLSSFFLSASKTACSKCVPWIHHFTLWLSIALPSRFQIDSYFITASYLCEYFPILQTRFMSRPGGLLSML